MCTFIPVHSFFADAVPGESEQEEHRERETGEALDHVDAHEPPDLAAGCEVGGEDRGTAAQGQGERRDAQAARSQRLVQPRIRDPFAPEQEGCPGQHGADRAEAEAMRQRAAYPVQTAAAAMIAKNFVLSGGTLAPDVKDAYIASVERIELE